MCSEAFPRAIPASGEYYNLGSFSRRVSTNSSEAQIWFDRGLTWAYSFNHGEAGKCFKQVIAHDAQCAMGYWGMAFVSGPNYNKSWKIFGREDRMESLRICMESISKARENLHTASAVEKALVEALRCRFSADHTQGDLEGLVGTNKAYADAMRGVWQRYGDVDLDVVALYADALMNTAPWKLFNIHTGEPTPSSPALEIQAVLERGFQQPGSNAHPGLLHTHIHLMEMSSTPEAVMSSANHLRNLIPDAGHMRHMPTHIDILLGNYQEAIRSNLEATVADDKFYAREGGKNFYSFYRLHNYHSLIYAAMLAGQCRVALEAVERMEATIAPDMLETTSPPMADWLESFWAIRVHVLIRFGLWEGLKALRLPDDPDLYCVTTAMVHYGKGIAWAATRNTEEATKERDLFRESIQKVPSTRLDFPNKMVNIFKIATEMLDGEIEYRLGNFDTAFEKLRAAIALDDQLTYSEPWGWMLPARHPYAALLLEQGHVEEAARVYAEDLGLRQKGSRANRHPGNVWALQGYHECLTRLGRTAEAQKIREKLDAVMGVVDVPIRSSCFCRLKVIL